MVAIDKSSSKPYYEQLMLSIKADIFHGILRPGDRLPSVRELAKELLMNPNTVSKAYKILENEQVLVTIRGKGTFVKKEEYLPRDELRIRHLKEQLSALVVEAAHLRVSQEELMKWLAENFSELGGSQDESQQPTKND